MEFGEMVAYVSNRLSMVLWLRTRVDRNQYRNQLISVRFDLLTSSFDHSHLGLLRS